MVYSIAWDEAVPAGSAASNQLDTFIQNDKIAVRERLEDFFPDWSNDGVDPKVLRLLNNTYMKARNAANSADVNLIKLNASDQVEIPEAVVLGSTLSTGGAITEAGTALSAKYAALAHTHPAADIASGIIATARLGSGTANNTKFLRGDQTWADPSTNFSFATLYRSTNQSLSNGWQTVQLDAAIEDADGLLDAINGTAVIVTAGVYDIIGAITFDTNSTGFRGVGIAVNDIIKREVIWTPAGGHDTGDEVNWTGTLAANDVIKLKAFHNDTGSARNVIAGTDPYKLVLIIKKRAA